MSMVVVNECTRAVVCLCWFGLMWFDAFLEKLSLFIRFEAGTFGLSPFQSKFSVLPSFDTFVYVRNRKLSV